LLHFSGNSAAKQQLDQCKIPSDGVPIIVRWCSDQSHNQQSFGIPRQTKVSGDCQRETTHEICCLGAEFAQISTPDDK